MSNQKQQTKVFVDGLKIEKREGKYGEYFILSADARFIDFYNEHKKDNGYLDMFGFYSREGNLYLQLPNNDSATKKEVKKTVDAKKIAVEEDENLPF